MLEMEEALFRFLRRRLPDTESEDALAGVRESVVRQMQGAQLASDHPSWFGASDPDAGEAGEFDRILWRLARLRQLDQLRGLYARRAIERDVRPSPRETPGGQLEAREFLRLLAIELDAMPEHDRDLLVRDIDPEASDDPLSNADRVRVHRLRSRLAQHISKSLLRGKERE